MIWLVEFFVLRLCLCGLCVSGFDGLGYMCLNLLFDFLNDAYDYWCQAPGCLRLF